MSSVDDRLRQAFGTPDEEWVRRARRAHGELRARHRRRQLVRRSAAGALAVAALVVAVTVVDGDAGTRTIQPADPTPTTTTHGRCHAARGDLDLRSVGCIATCGRPPAPRAPRPLLQPCSRTCRPAPSGW